MCDWFLLCENDPVGTVRHPVLGEVPTCRECADRHDLTFSGEDSTGFRGFCMEPECVWSSNARSSYSQAEAEVQDHLRSVHGLTDVSQVKFDIDETS